MTKDRKLYHLNDKQVEMLLDGFYKYFIAQAPNRQIGQIHIVDFAQISDVFKNPIMQQIQVEENSNENQND